MAITIPSGFNITVQQPVDARIVLTKAQMAAMVDAKMPTNYLAVCSDDGKLYLYNVNNTALSTTGKFRVFEGGEPDAYLKSASVSNNTLTLTKQDDTTVTFTPQTGTTYTAGDNIQISDQNVISATDTTYTAGTNISIENNVISAIDTKIATSITLGKEITASQTVGGIAEGTVYSADTTLADIIEDLLGGSGPTPTDTKLYYGVGSTVPTDVSGLTAVSTDADTLLTNGYTWKNVTLNNEYPFLAIDKTLGITCYEILQNGFSLGFITVDLGNQILYYPDTKGTDTDVRLVYHFEE